MRRAILALIGAVLISTGVVSAQQKECGNGLPCGSIPWPLSNPPALQSPTPMPTYEITAVFTPTISPTPSATFTPGTPTLTPEPTTGVMTDFTELGNQLATLQSSINSTPIPIMVSGTPVNADSQYVELGLNAGTFFGYVRGFTQANFGGLSTLINFVILAFVTVIGFKSVSFILPIAAAIFGIILKIVQFVIRLLGGSG